MESTGGKTTAPKALWFSELSMPSINRLFQSLVGRTPLIAALLTPRRVVPERLLESRSKEGTAPGDRKISEAKFRAFNGRSATARSVRTFPSVDVSVSNCAD